MASTVTLQVWWKGPGRMLPRFAMDGKRVSLPALAKMYGLPEYALLARISRGLHLMQWLLPAVELSRVTKQEGRRVA
ncbi:MAG: hypothetical protein KME02_03780 [Aphanothece saxicola GSE-SYN-MK-01-06B]|jgi:hypothetical protein|nr:hypothetical protein [Aphanothece saxicola GSE-SYN-MK-01-06B]